MPNPKQEKKRMTKATKKKYMALKVKTDISSIKMVEMKIGWMLHGIVSAMKESEMQIIERSSYKLMSDRRHEDYKLLHLKIESLFERPN